MGIQVRKANGQIFNLPDAPEFTGDGNTLPGQQLEQFYQRLFFEQASGLGDQIVVDGKVVRTNTPGNGGNFGSFVKDFVTKVVLPVAAVAVTAGQIGPGGVPLPTTGTALSGATVPASQIGASALTPAAFSAGVPTAAGGASALAQQIAAASGLANQTAIGTGVGAAGDLTAAASGGGLFKSILGSFGEGGLGRSALTSPVVGAILQSVLAKPPRQQPQFALGQSKFGLNQDKLGLADAIFNRQGRRDNRAANLNRVFNNPFATNRGLSGNFTATQTDPRVLSLLDTLLNATQQQTLPGNAIQQIV